MAIVLNRMWPFLRYRIRFSCFRKIKTFVDKIDAEGLRSNKKADGFPDFEPRLNGRIGFSGFLGPVRRSARSASGCRTVTPGPPAAFHLGHISRRLEAFEQ